MTDEQTQKITPGKYVEITYNLYTLDGDKATLVHQVDVEDPERLVFGVTQGMIEPLEKALDGLTVGDEFSVKSPPTRVSEPTTPRRSSPSIRKSFSSTANSTTTASLSAPPCP